MKTWFAQVKLTKRGEVVIEAETEEDAIALADTGQWSGDESLELVDWTVSSIREAKS